MRLSALLVVMVVLCSCVSFAMASPADSLRMTKIGGKSYIVHEVEAGETLYALSRRYKVPVDKIIAANPAAEASIEIGQLVNIPYLGSSDASGNADVIHVVKAQETLSSIARQYGINYRDIKKWNNLTSNSLNIGQRLKIKRGSQQVDDVSNSSESTSNNSGSTNDSSSENDADYHEVESGETLSSISRKYGVKLDNLMRWNNLSSPDIRIGQKIRISGGEETVQQTNDDNDNNQSDSDPIESNPTDQSSEQADSSNSSSESSTETVDVIKISQSSNASGFEEIVESGLAELIEGSGDTRKYLALHRTAKIGTVMKVRNEMNNKQVFVRVLGRLPETDANKKVLIKISQAAYDNLGAIDKRFRIELSYLP
ncbi:MAG: LysM peptidoglycan-binding domain-containing protein [Bacteroidota bacterium]